MEVEFERPFDLREKEKTRLKEVQKLKRKNQDLATITRKLEEKVKSLEKKTKESPSTERRNKLKEKQKEKEVEYEKQLMARDQEIQKLKNRMKDLVRKLTGKNGEITRAQSTLELEHIIRTVTKERLQLERHLAVATEGLSSKGPGEAEALRVASLEETNKTLESQLGDLDLLTRQHHTLEKHVHDKDLECVTLKEKLKLKNELCQDLECQLARVIQKNTALTIQNSDLQKQIQELQHVSEECRSLKHTLNTVETDWSSTKLQVGQLHGNVATLESVLRQMKEAAEKRRDLERQHAEAQQQLREKQALVNELSHRPGSNANEWERKAQQEAIASLQSKIRELEKLGETQNLRHEELLLEMQSLKKAQGSPKNSWSRSGSLSADLQSPDSGDVTPGLTSLNSLSSGIYTATTTSSSVIYDRSGRHSPNHTHHHHGGPPTENVSSEIDRIMAKIAQDNKILEELDKSRSTIDKNLVNGNIPGVIVPSYETDNRVLDVLEIPGKGRCHVYIARYSYDPFQHSPNENPEAELAVNAGDYVLVWGSMDEVAPRTIVRTSGLFSGKP